MPLPIRKSPEPGRHLQENVGERFCHIIHRLSHIFHSPSLPLAVRVTARRMTSTPPGTTGRCRSSSCRRSGASGNDSRLAQAARIEKLENLYIAACHHVTPQGLLAIAWRDKLRVSDTDRQDEEGLAGLFTEAKCKAYEDARTYKTMKNNLTGKAGQGSGQWRNCPWPAQRKVGFTL